MNPEGFLRIEIFVRDVPRAVAFYRDVLGFVAGHGSAGYVPMTRGGAHIGIGASADLPGRHYFRPDVSSSRLGIGAEIVIEVDDVDAAYRRVAESGHPVLTALRERPWGARDFRIADPDGYYLRITSH